MQVYFTMDGATYNAHKDGFKAIIKRHGYAWKGNRTSTWWASPTEKLTATYERDQADEVTLGATLCWEGTTESMCLTQLRAWAAESGAAEGGAARHEATLAVSQSREQRIWELVWKPHADSLRAQGRPRAWIEKDRAAYEQALAQRQQHPSPRT